MQPNPDADCIFETATVSQPLQEHEITMANVSFEYNNSNEDLIGQNVDGTGWDLDLNDGLEKWDEFDQSVEVARDLKENSLDILGENSVEFARDAQRVSFSPVRESFASIKDMEMDNENPVDFSFEKNDMFEFPINEPIEQMEQIDQMEIDQPEEINLPAGNKTVRKRSHKQKKVIVDSSIQISAAEWKRGLLDTSSLLAPDPYYPKTRFLQQLSEIGFKCIHKTVPKRFARLLETDDKYHPRRVALRALINRNGIENLI